MTDSRKDDVALLIDFVSGQCPPQLAEQVKQRLAEEPEFKALRETVANTFEAINLLGEHDPPAGLADRTIAAIRQKQQVHALIAREEAARPVSRRVFSMRELSVIAAVLLVLAAVFIPSVRQARQSALINKCESNVGRIGSAILSYANANNDYLPSVDDAGPRWLPSPGHVASSNSAALFKLVKGGYESPVIFQCPATASGSFVVRSGFADFPEARYVNYSYQHTMGPDGLNRLGLRDVAKDMAILADSTPVFEDGKFNPERIKAATSSNHNRRGQNVLYLTGSVRWAENADAGVRGDNIFLAKGVFEYDGDEKPSGMTDSFLLPSYTANGK